MLLVNSVSHKISLGEDAPIAFGAPVGLGRDCLRRSRGGGNLLPILALSLKTHRLTPVLFFYALSLLKYISMRTGHKKTRPFGAGFQAQCLIFSGEGGIRTRGTVTRTAV